MTTKGPWTAEDCRVYSENSTAVCFTWDKNDARLIAAAPDLYEALKSVRGTLITWGVYDRLVCSDVVDAAIAKAEGK